MLAQDPAAAAAQVERWFGGRESYLRA